jgi:peptidyl-prolyl cis-trans isomerase B (cyclophilin B)
MTDYTHPENLDDQHLADTLVDIEVSIDGQNAGTITLEFWPQAAPATVRNFIRYAAEGFYDGIGFHRIIEGFMVQGGCPQGTGTGSGPHGMIVGEFSSDAQYSHQRGVISMARSQDPNSASCQFFICHGSAEFLDGQYAAFGRMTAGEEALEKLGTVATKHGGGGEKSTPAAPCKIEGMKVYSRI